MSRAGDDRRRRAAHETGRQIAELIGGTGLPQWWQVTENGSPAQDSDEYVQLRLRMVDVLLQTFADDPRSQRDSVVTDPAGYLCRAHTTGDQIVRLIRELDRPWWRDPAGGLQLWSCLQMADYLASAESAAEAEQFVKLLRQAMRRDMPGLAQAGDDARAVGQQVRKLIWQAGPAGRSRLFGDPTIRRCLRFASYLAEAGPEAEAEQFLRLLGQEIRRYSEDLDHVGPYDKQTRLGYARAIGRQVAGLLRRTDLAWQSGPGTDPLVDCLAIADQLADATSEVDAERLATQLGKAIRGGAAALRTDRAELQSDLRAMAVQTDRIAFGFVSAGRHWQGGMQLRSALELPPTVSRTTHMFIVPEQVTPRDLVRRWVEAGHDPGRLARGLLRLSVAVLPAPVQARYTEEYGAELWAMRKGSRLRRTGYALRLANRAWQLRRSLRGAGIALWTAPPREP